MSKRALLFLLSFTITYLCKMVFSSMLTIKIKLRNKVNVDPTLRLKLSNTEPNISTLISTMHIHPYH